MDEKYIRRGLRRQFRGLGWCLVGYYALLNYMVSVDMMVAAFREMLRSGIDWIDAFNMETVTGSGWGYIVAVGIALLVLFVWKNRSFWFDRVLAKRRPMTFGTFVIMLCLGMGVQLVSSFWISTVEVIMNMMDRSLMDLLEQVSGSSSSVSLFIYASFLAPISEELIFRGWIQKSLEPYGKKFSIVCAAFLFAIFHGNLIQTPFAFGMGLLFGYLAAEYHIGWAIGAHVFNNLVLADLLTRATASLPEEIASMIHLGIMGMAFLVSMVVLIASREKIRQYLRSDWMDRRCLRGFFLNSGTIAITILMTLMGMMIFVM